jgi:hypothetical protein
MVLLPARDGNGPGRARPPGAATADSGVVCTGAECSRDRARNAQHDAR